MKFMFSLFVLTLAVIGFFATFSVKYGQWYLCISPKEYVVRAIKNEIKDKKAEENTVPPTPQEKPTHTHTQEEWDPIMEIIERDMQ